MGVTLLFTDIEGSTRLVQELGDAYPETLEDHRAAVRAAIAATRGEEIDCRGDEFSVAFATPDEAVAGARLIQESHTGRVRVRIGIHTGAPLRVDGSYVGLDVHRAARICAAAHGGQVLLSETSRAALASPDSLRDLGSHQLRGLSSPERLYQLGEGHFPALRADVADEGLGAPIRVVLADDSILLREGIARLLDDAGFEIVAQVDDADRLLEEVQSGVPDVVVTDIRMPPTHTDEGLRAAQEIRERHPEVGVLVLSQYLESGYALALLQSGADGVGYLLKDRVSDVEEFAAAVKRVAEGGSALDREVVTELVVGRGPRDALSLLTPVERDVLELIAEGRSNHGIADRLGLSGTAVEEHVAGIFRKLRLSETPGDRVPAVLAYLRR